MDDRGSRRRRVLFVGSARYDLPLDEGLARKWSAVEDELDIRVIGRAGTVERQDARFRLVASPPSKFGAFGFYGSLPRVTAAEIRAHRPDVLVMQSPYEAFAAQPFGRRRDRPRVIVEVHGDWRTAARVYGSPLRRMYARVADRAATTALRRADATRALSGFTAELAERVTGSRPVAVFPTYFDLESFIAEAPRPLPERPAVAWIGVLQAYKNPGLLADAWRIAGPRVPEAQLAVVGEGPLRPIIDDLVRDLPSQVRLISHLDPPGVAELLDNSTVLAMSSDAEGLGRVILEAFARARPVVAPAAGGPVDVIKPEHNGLLVPPRDAEQLAAALVRVLRDGEFAQRLSDGAREDSARLRWKPSTYAQAVREMVDRVLTDPGVPNRDGTRAPAPSRPS